VNQGKTKFQSDEIDLVVFDMGHVIIDFEWAIVCQGFLQRAGWSHIEDFQPILAKVGKLGYEVGKISTEDFRRELNKLLSTDIDEQEFTELWNATFRENETMALLLEQLKRRYPLYLLSNTNDNHYNYIQENFDIERHFDELILSYRVGSAKPEHDIYHEVMRRSGLPPKRCLFIDDLPENIEAAIQCGMQAILFSSADELLHDFNQLGLITAHSS